MKTFKYNRQNRTIKLRWRSSSDLMTVGALPPSLNGFKNSKTSGEKEGISNWFELQR